MLEKAVVELAELRPSFVSVTYGALGSTRERTRDVVTRINHEQPFPAMPHLTCVGHTRADIAELLDHYADQRGREHPRPRRRPARRRLRPGRRVRARLAARRAGARPPGRVLGRRGRPPGGAPSLAGSGERPPPPRRQARGGRLRDDRSSSSRSTTTCASSTSWPSSGCDKPVLPGVMPFINLTGLVRMAGMNGSVIPAPLLDRLRRGRRPARRDRQDRHRGRHRARRRPPRRGRPRPAPLRPQPQRLRSSRSTPTSAWADAGVDHRTSARLAQRAAASSTAQPGRSGACRSCARGGVLASRGRRSRCGVRDRAGWRGGGRRARRSGGPCAPTPW